MKITYQERIIKASPEHHFTVVNARTFENEEAGSIRDYMEFGEVTLLNILTDEADTFTIWGEEIDDLYVCLPNGDLDDDGDEQLDDYTMDDLGIEF